MVVDTKYSHRQTGGLALSMSMCSNLGRSLEGHLDIFIAAPPQANAAKPGKAPIKRTLVYYQPFSSVHTIKDWTRTVLGTFPTAPYCTSSITQATGLNYYDCTNCLQPLGKPVQVQPARRTAACQLYRCNISKHVYELTEHSGIPPTRIAPYRHFG